MKTEKLRCQLIIKDHLPKDILKSVGLDKPIYLSAKYCIFEPDNVLEVITKLEDTLSYKKDDDYVLRLSITENIVDDDYTTSMYLDPESSRFKKGHMDKEKNFVYILCNKVRQIQTNFNKDTRIITCTIKDYCIDYASEKGFSEKTIFNASKYTSVEEFLSDDLKKDEKLISAIKQGRARIFKKIKETK